VFSLSHTPIEVERLKSSLVNAKAGALSTFEGWVRNHNDGRAVRELAYEAAESLAVKEATKIIEEARAKFEICDAVCVHRVGDLQIGDLAVWVGVSSVHRDTAFSACRYIIDEIKLRLPIWKKETYTDGSSGWVNCQACTHSDSRAGRERAHADEQAACATATEHGHQ
jgi:molybdopterin synthase catalytic subunit